MRALADLALGIQIDKSIRREDWLRRPIQPAMLSYAHQDAELTIRLYRWFIQHHPEAVEAHARRRYHPSLPEGTPEWLARYLTKRVDIARLLKDLRIDPVKQEGMLVADIRTAEGHGLSPGQQRRLLRLIGDLKLSALYDDVLPYAHSRSAVFRSSAARALGRLGDERAIPVLECLRSDHIADVQTVAVAALAELATKDRTEQRRPRKRASLHLSRKPCRRSRSSEFHCRRRTRIRRGTDTVQSRNAVACDAGGSPQS